MSSDPLADLARSLTDFAQAFRDVLTRNPQPAPGSPAEKEGEGEQFAGDWGEHPSRDIFAATYLQVTSCTDHLLALAPVLTSRRSVFAPYTLARGALEAAAGACYLTDNGIDARERLRRNMNSRLVGFCEQIWMLKTSTFTSDDAARKIAYNEKRIGQFERTATRHGFRFEKAKRIGVSAYLDKPTPPIMDLVGLAVDNQAPELGKTYYRLLSAAAHSEIHGLARLLVPVGSTPGRPGEALAAVNLDAESLARELVAGPLAAHSMAKGVEWFTGCDLSDLHGPANQMLCTWARVGKLQLPEVTP
jgi:hypothetical protein